MVVVVVVVEQILDNRMGLRIAAAKMGSPLPRVLVILYGLRSGNPRRLINLR
jgi:hypothetical protein